MLPVEKSEVGQRWTSCVLVKFLFYPLYYFEVNPKLLVSVFLLVIITILITFVSEKSGCMDVDEEDVMILVPPLFAPKDIPESLV